MESLSETKWDVVISGTGLQNSLLALALSRSDKKILHVDQNEYYGGSEAAFSLQETREWVEKVNDGSHTTFQNASLWTEDADAANETSRLSFSRAYTLTLSPQIIYTRSKLLTQLVSSKVYRQLEFQAVGNWWIFDDEGESTLKRLPNGREDIFQDKAIDNRSKRSLMKFLKFVIDFENQPETCQLHHDSGLAEFLSSEFQLSVRLQSVIAALTLSLDSPSDTKVVWALPRIARHLTSIGLFGPGFGAVVPKWGGGAEVAQVACRAGAVGGGVYVLGTGVESSEAVTRAAEQSNSIYLSNGEVVTTAHLISLETRILPRPKVICKAIAVVSSSLPHLFKNSVEGSPLAAVSVVVLPVGTITVQGVTQTCPVYIMVHSSDTGECPAGQCVLYASMLHTTNSKAILDAALTTFLNVSEYAQAQLLYKLYYEQIQQARAADPTQASAASIDLAFNDELLEDIEAQWKIIMGGENEVSFMKFEDREGQNDSDGANDGV